jgi:hypothetical protein
VINLGLQETIEPEHDCHIKWIDEFFCLRFIVCVCDDFKNRMLCEREKIIWNFDNAQKAYATRGYEAKEYAMWESTLLYTRCKTTNPLRNILALYPISQERPMSLPTRNSKYPWF